MSELKKFGDPDYGPYGYGWCNPAFYNQEPVSNEQYIATIPDDDPWKPVIVAGVKQLDIEFPGWRVVQIKEKFWECRFYADYSTSDPAELGKFQDTLTQIERECDAVTRSAE